MLPRVPAVALLLFSVFTGLPLEGQERPSQLIAATAPTPPPLLADRPILGVSGSGIAPRLEACLADREPSGRGTTLLAVLATGIFFGAILGGIHGGNQKGCDGCDFEGAVAGGAIGGLAGLAVGIIIPPP